MSSVAVTMPKSEASSRHASANGISSPRLMASMAYRSAIGGLAASSAASARASFIRSAAGTTRLTNPIASASDAENRITRQNQLHRLRLADQARQPLRAGKSWNQPEVDLRLAEPCGVGRDAQRTRHGELAAAAEREAVDGRDDRLAEPLDEIEHVLPGQRALPRALGRVARDLVDVGAGDEGFVASAGHDDERMDSSC